MGLSITFYGTKKDYTKEIGYLGFDNELLNTLFIFYNDRKESIDFDSFNLHYFKLSRKDLTYIISQVENSNNINKNYELEVLKEVKRYRKNNWQVKCCCSW